MVHSVSGWTWGVRVKLWERVPYLSALEVCSRRGAIQIHVYLYLLPFVPSFPSLFSLPFPSLPFPIIFPLQNFSSFPLPFPSVSIFFYSYLICLPHPFPPQNPARELTAVEWLHGRHDGTPFQTSYRSFFIYMYTCNQLPLFVVFYHFLLLLYTIPIHLFE